MHGRPRDLIRTSVTVVAGGIIVLVTSDERVTVVAGSVTVVVDGSGISVTVEGAGRVYCSS